MFHTFFFFLFEMIPTSLHIVFMD